MGLLISETWINKTEGHGIGESGVYESRHETPGELYRALQKEYGRCVSKVYIDEFNNTKCIGWVFEQTAKYEDTGKSYIRETWVSVHKQAPETKTTYHYQTIDGKRG